MLNVLLMMIAASAATAQATASSPQGEAAITTPADRLDQLDRFRANLSRDDRARLDKALPRSADGGIARCDATQESRASCEAAAYMPALRSTGLTHRFLASLKTKHSRNWLSIHWMKVEA